MSADTRSFDSNPAISKFTWEELLAYNNDYIQGKRNKTFYNCGAFDCNEAVRPLLTELNMRGIFVLDYESAWSKIIPDVDTSKLIKYRHRGYMDGCMPLKLATTLINNAKNDPDVLVEVSHIATKKQVYLSKKLKTLWNHEKYMPISTYRELQSHHWNIEASIGEPMGMLYCVEDKNFIHWNKWLIDDDLCYFFIIDKKYGQMSKIMAERMIGYFS